MASKNFNGILRDPLGTLANNDKYRFTHVSTTGEVIRGSTSYLNIGDDGVYNIDIEYGNVTIESYSELGKRWINQGTTTINADTAATTLPALLNALVPASDPLLIQLESLLADAEQAASEATSRSIASTTDMQSATNDSKISTPLKVKQAIDFHTGTAATRDVGESAGNVMAVGAFGLGSSTRQAYDTDADDVAGHTHFVRFGGTTANTPVAGNTYHGYSTGPSGFQMVRVTELSGNANTKPRIFERANRNGTWTNWVEIYHKGNIVGTVSQSGEVPRGAIIESGSNTNGSYTKWADGTMICSHSFAVGSRSALGSGTYSDPFRTSVTDWTYPSLFSEINVVNGMCNAASGVFGARGSCVTSQAISNSQATGIQATAISDALSNATVIFFLSAIGRWY